MKCEHPRIISYLDSSHDVAAFSLSCRALHSMCNMPMRKKFHLIRVYPDDEGIDQAFGLLMGILKRPSLGQYVREIRHSVRPNATADICLNWHPRLRIFYPSTPWMNMLAVIAQIISKVFARSSLAIPPVCL